MSSYHDLEAEYQAGVDEFDRRLAALRGESVPSERRSRIQALAEQGATEGEREAARAALERLEHRERMSRLDDEAEGYG